LLRNPVTNNKFNVTCVTTKEKTRIKIGDVPPNIKKNEKEATASSKLSQKHPVQMMPVLL
jgi:hypothetical protein